MAYKDAEFEYYQDYLNKQNTASAKNQMDFQKMMSDSSHQREVADLLKAGLNPALSLNNGASTPAGSYANVDSTPVTARSQQKMNQANIDAQLKQTEMSLRNQYEIAKLQAGVQLASSRYASQMAYAGQVYSANSGYDAAIYGYDTSASNTQYTVENQSQPGIFRQAYKYLTGKEWDDNSGRTAKSDLTNLWNGIKSGVKNWITGQKNDINRKKQSNLTARQLAKTEKETQNMIKFAKDANVRWNNYLDGNIKRNINSTKVNTNKKNKIKNK